MATLTQDNRTSSTLTLSSRTAAVTLTHDSRHIFHGQGKISGAFLHPIFMTSSTNSNLFVQDTRTT